MRSVVNYRDRLYANYGHHFQDASKTFDHQAAHRWGRARSYHLRNWLPEEKSSRIVDLACGGGKLLHFFVEQGYKNVEGVDISPDQVALSRQVVSEVTEGHVIEFLESNPDQFDLITGFDIIEHFFKDEVLQFLEAAYSALRPNGRLILQTPNAESPWGAQHRYNDFTHEIGFNPNALGRLLRVVGFSAVEPRECGPVPLGNSIFSGIRFTLWQGIRLGLMAYNLIETGNPGDKVFTRVFLISGVKSP